MCHEDELWSPFAWDGADPKPPIQAWIDAGLRCYRCGWDSERRIAIGSVSSAIAAMFLQKQIDAGKGITIPSLGIVIPGEHL